MAKRRTFLVKLELETNDIDSSNIEEEIRVRLGRKIVKMVDAKEETG